MIRVLKDLDAVGGKLVVTTQCPLDHLNPILLEAVKEGLVTLRFTRTWELTAKGRRILRGEKILQGEAVEEVTA